MKIVVSVHELATETQLVIDNMRRSNAPVLIGDPNKPVAVLIALEEYDRLLREAQKASAAAAAAASAGAAAPVRDTTQPLPASKPAMAEAEASPAAPVRPAHAEVLPASQPANIVQRAAAAIQANPAAPAQPKVVSQRGTTLQPDPTLAAGRAAPALRSRLSKPLPRPPQPLRTPRSRPQLSLASIPGGWQTVALIAGMLALGIVGFALIIGAVGG
ncbi:MAG TPA: type II toxin-antitoxin system Phd/YefM family antitoxin [Anaerolineae bacterium]|nr:type II toxin-antitoxin system Phd/YefM family antitoxin [Anaerolineae bacterium]